MGTLRILCVKQAPIVNRKQRITVWKIGDEATVPDDGYWRGLLDEGVIGEVAGERIEPAIEPEGPAVRRRRKRK